MDDQVLRADADTGKLGHITILLSSAVGSPWWFQHIYMDSMAVVSYFGRPSLFITITTNPNWPAIQRELFLEQSASDRPDVVVRVFNLIVRNLLADLKKGVFGLYVAVRVPQ